MKINWAKAKFIIDILHKIGFAIYNIISGKKNNNNTNTDEQDKTNN